MEDKIPFDAFYISLNKITDQKFNENLEKYNYQLQVLATECTLLEIRILPSAPFNPL